MSYWGHSLSKWENKLMRQPNSNLTNLLKRGKIILLVGWLLLQFTTSTFAQSGGSFDLSWWAVVGGGGASSGGNYTLTGAIGQPEAGMLSGGSYTLTGGFGSGVSGDSSNNGGTGEESHTIYLPLILHE
jgi:hypothetical protein